MSKSDKDRQLEKKIDDEYVRFVENLNEQGITVKKRLIDTTNRSIEYFNSLNRGCPPSNKKPAVDKCYHDSICYLELEDEIGDVRYGTGFLISDTCVITAAHNLYMPNDQRKGGRLKKVSWVHVYPGFKGEPHLNWQKSNQFKKPRRYSRPGCNNYDYAAIILPRSVSNGNSGVGLSYHTPKNKGAGIEISGYPKGISEQFFYTGYISESDNHTLEYDIRTTTGISGAPVMECHNDEYVVVGVHGGAVGQEQNTCPKRCIKVRKAVSDCFDRWKDADY